VEDERVSSYLRLLCARIDTGKSKLDVAIDSQAGCLQLDNDPNGHAILVAWRACSPADWHRGERRLPASVTKPRAEGFQVIVLQPKQVREAGIEAEISRLKKRRAVELKRLLAILRPFASEGHFRCFAHAGLANPFDLLIFANTVLPEKHHGPPKSLSKFPQTNVAEPARGIDRVEAGRVAREETPSGALGLDRFPDFRALVRGKIVDPDNVAGQERRNGPHEALTAQRAVRRSLRFPAARPLT
jgi:hypothetical protein